MTSRRVTVVTSEVLGVAGGGGPGTADSLLAIALGRAGHCVELLVAPGRHVAGLSPEWSTAYAAANVHVRPLSEHTRVEPAFLSPTWHVLEALRGDPPDVVVADDWRALAYAPLRARHVGRALDGTAVVLYCHGPARVFAAAARKVPDTVARFGEEVAQRACFALADAVVSPSRWLLDCLRGARWPEPHAEHVIQNLWESAATGAGVERVDGGGRIRRLAFFGQLREGKGLRVFVDALALVDAALLRGVDVAFIGAARRWSPDEIERMLSGRVASVDVKTGLERSAALSELAQPGTLAVLPSLLENSPYAVAECIERGVPFVAARVGGTPELVAEEDRARVLCEPTPEAFAAAVERALTSAEGLAPARPAQAPDRARKSWLDLVERVAPRPQAPVPSSRDEWSPVGDVSSDLLDTLLAAQAATGADAVTTGARTPDGVQLFLGDPGALGVVENQYGAAGIVRRSLGVSGPSPWVTFARAAAAGAAIVSVPEPLGAPAAAAQEGDPLAVLEAFEDSDVGRLHDFPQLAATLAAALERGRRDGASVPRGLAPRLARSVRRRLG